MKYLFIMINLLYSVAAISQKQIISATKVDTIAKPKEIKDVIEFKNAEHDFGKLQFGKPVEYELEMKNISKDTVKIENIQVTCGCTTPKWDASKRYAPGDSFKVTLGFSGSIKGPFNKTVTVFFNGGLMKMVTFKGETYEVVTDSSSMKH